MLIEFVLKREADVSLWVPPMEDSVKRWLDVV